MLAVSLFLAARGLVARLDGYFQVTRGWGNGFDGGAAFGAWVLGMSSSRHRWWAWHSSSGWLRSSASW